MKRWEICLYDSEINPLITTSATGKAMPSLNLPPNSDSDLTGTQIGKSLLNILGQKRDDAFVDQIRSGNIPNCVRNLVPITIINKGNTLQYWVSGDVLSVGSDDDYLRISLNGKSAKKLLDTINCMMPTKKMCDDIFRLADLKLNPLPMGASSAMSNTQTLINHNVGISKQIAGRDFKLITGHKKDTVIAKHLLEDRSRCAIYGWFYPSSGKPIQDLQSKAHSWDYQDYSQSVRMILRSATLNDQPIDLYDILNNPQLAYLISEEGSYNPLSIYT